MFTLRELSESSKDPRLQGLIGKWILVGLCQYYEGEIIKQSQDFGQMIEIDDSLIIQKADGDTWKIPVNYEAVIPAPRGKYKLKTTGEEILNPDYLLSWRIDLMDEIEESTWRANTAPHVDSIVAKEWDFEYEYDRETIDSLIRSTGEALIGKTLLVGISHYKQIDGQSKLDRQTQLYGKIMRVSLHEGVVIELKDGTEHKLPPDISLIQPAPIGEYTLTSTNETIIDPDYMTKWVVKTK